jgi:hypothetical protein
MLHPLAKLKGGSSMKLEEVSNPKPDAENY